MQIKDIGSRKSEWSIVIIMKLVITITLHHMILPIVYWYYFFLTFSILFSFTFFHFYFFLYYEPCTCQNQALTIFMWGDKADPKRPKAKKIGQLFVNALGQAVLAPIPTFSRFLPPPPNLSCCPSPCRRTKIHFQQRSRKSTAIPCLL